MNSVVQIRHGILAAMHEEASKTPTFECCGLLAGNAEIITAIFPATNVHPNPATGYEIAPQELFHLMKEIRARDLQLMGIYHSHPRGENFPSSKDIERAFYPETPYFILSPLRDAAQPVRAFLIRDSEVVELKIEAV